MTTSIDIKTRGLGAKVEVDNGDNFDMGPNQTRRIDTTGAVTVTVTQEAGQEQPAVPGSAENDALVKEVPTETLDKLSGKQPAGNKTGAAETSATTEQK